MPEQIQTLPEATGRCREKNKDLGSSEYHWAGWSTAGLISGGTVPLPPRFQTAAERGPGTRCDARELSVCPVLLLGTYLSTRSVMNRSTDKAFREISNSIASACSCSSCGGTNTALGFQAPFPRSYREAGCWLPVGNHRLGRKPEHCKTNSASHLDCASTACLPGQPQKSLQPSVARPSSPYP